MMQLRFHANVLSRLSFLMMLGMIIFMSRPALANPRPLILAHYMPWFSAKPYSQVWGWHWTMNAFDPEQQKNGRRNIASHYYPLIGPYDSGDPVVIEYHLLLMKLAGVDGVVVDWYGRGELYDYPIVHRNTTALFQVAARYGLKFAVCYEDQSVSNRVTAGKLSSAQRVPQAREDIQWLQQSWFKSPYYLKHNGKPVLLSFGFSGLSDDEWVQVLPPGQTTLLYLSEHHKRKAAVGAFDWPVPKEVFPKLDAFYTRSKDWPVSMPVAFSRFHDIYAEAKVHESWGRIEDNRGQTFTQTLQRALRSGAPFVQIATWNDWGEGTMIEPSVEFGYRDLETVQRLRRQMVDSVFATTASDLRLAHRLFLLRRQQAQSPDHKAKLDRIAHWLATGSFRQARQGLKAQKSAAGKSASTPLR